ncbi:hypothetical protein MMC20_001792 [Loxospora ochrophaea]|nr:hypothetical protein [Loxospora ochrophaea]
MHEIDISTQNQLPDLSTTLNPEAHFSNALSPSLGLSGYSGPQTSWSTPVSRSNSNKRRESANVVRDNRRSLTALGALSLDRPNVGLSHTRPGATSVSSSTASTPLSSSQSSYANQFSQLIKPDQINSTNGLHADTSSNDSAFIHGLSRMQGLSHGAGDGFDWPDQFQSGSKEDNLSSLFQPPVRSGRGQVKGESESAHVSYGSATDGRHDDLINGIFDSGSASPVTDGVSDDFHSWSLDQSQIDPLEGKVRHLTNFCFPDRQSSVYANDAETQALRYSLTVDNVRHFLDRFSNFQCHWPIIHMPTFDAVKTYDGLILAMMCIGAVYSNRMNVAQVRALVRGTLKAMEQKSSVFEFLKHATISMSGRDMDEYKTAHIEELQALILLLTLSVWHGDSAQRDSARADFAQCSLLVRKLGLLRPACSHCPIYSILHQPSSAVDQASPTDWNWNAWIGQEKLSRLMYAFFLTDAALVIYFNCDPHFNPAEITLPLPADDAPWEAKTADTCASALGLYGPAAQSGNTTGSRRQKQPEMAKAMKALLHPTYEFQARSTNTYAKFILVHALHVQIWITLKQISLGHSYHGLGDLGYLTNGNTTPISQNDWVTRVDRSGNTSRSSSGQITPTDSSGAQSPDTHQMLKSATNALQKWKRMWDEDMTLQYPHSASASRRLGFCRDGIHFYWLARLFLRNPRAGLWRTPPDSRFVHVLHLLKQVRAWVASENAVRGEEIGSVSEIDDSYGMEGLTLDMKLLFTPLT